MPKLTKSLVESQNLPDKGQSFIWDTEPKGFGLRLTPTTKTYIVQGRVKGIDCRVTIGRHGVFTVQQASKRAKELLVDMANGINPNAEKKAKNAESVTLAEVCSNYIKDRASKLKPRTIGSIEEHVNRTFKDWEGKPIANITRSMVQQRFREISERSPSYANQAFRILRALCNYARATYRPNDRPILPENPCQVLSDAKVWHTIQPKSRKIPTNNIGHTWNFITCYRNNPAKHERSRTIADAVAFMALTGARRNEVLQMTWDRVDLAGGSWSLTDTKNRHPVTFPLSTQAQAILETRPKINEYVFACTVSKNGHPNETKYFMQKVSDHCGTKVSCHDLRRTFRAVAGEAGVEFYKTKLLMNHKISGDVTLHSYTETSDLRYLGKEAQAISDWIEQQASIANHDNVIQLRRKAA